MSTPIPPEIEYLNQVAIIGSSPTQIFSEDATCLLSSVWITNLVENQIKLTCYILKGIDSTPYSTDIRLITINPFDSIDLLKGSVWNVKYGEALFAYTNFSTDSCSSFISYEKLHELGEI